ncbi:MAG TPA: beta-propeller domain-containing protein [Pseudobacteroides sp.]|uniref:beta-propeller domain-containing protein n=1 Tax=Pseudobacteroides sp. TaxID=1968840 RepID=UPI002F925633
MVHTDGEISLKEFFSKYKLRFLLMVASLTVLEIIFLTLSAFVSWEDVLLRKSGVDLTHGGLLTTVFFAITFIMLCLFISSIMLNLDKRHLSIKDIFSFPTKKIILQYSLYFILSLIVRLVAFGMLLAGLIYISASINSMNGLFSLVIFLIFVSSILGLLDFVGANIKSLIILRYKSSFSYTFSADFTKGFLIEFFKNLSIILLYVVWTMLKQKYNIKSINPEGTLLLFSVFLIFNTITIISFKMRKDCLSSFEIMTDKYSSTLNSAGHNRDYTNKKSYWKLAGKLLFPALISLIIIFNAFIFITGLVNLSASPKPGIEALKSKTRYTSIIKSFTDNPNTYRSNELELPYLLCTGFLGNPEAFDSFYSGSVGLEMSKSDSASYKSSNSVSRTNTQVENIDEADIVKTDGKHIYYIKDRDLVIAKASPVDQMKVEFTKSFSLENLTPVEIMLYKNHISVVLGDGSSEYELDHPYYYDNSQNTIVRTYNIANPKNPALERTLKLKGSYKSSRLIENKLYIITTSSVKSNDNEIIYPEYYDTSTKQSTRDFDYNNAYYLSSSNKGIHWVNYISVFPMDNQASPSIVKAYAGNTDTIYVSEKYIYMAESSQAAIKMGLSDFWNNIDDSQRYDFYNYGTYIYRIKIQGDGLGECDTTFVDGRLHNQFSMDEYNGNLRLAVQSSVFRDSSSSVYILDDKLKQIGFLNRLAPGEQIYSTRFMGDRLYLVTFRNVDPLFVIDLKDSRHPKVLGELKIPGYSEYLHPYDENHIIGFGKDTKGGNEGFSWYQGIKMALFDVTDVNNPKEKFVEIIGDRGSDSGLLRNHKALLYMKHLGLMAFPVSVAEKTDNMANAIDDWSFGRIKFQGAYVYNVSSSEGFKLRGKISHDTQSDIPAVSNDYITKDPSFIERILYIDDVLYTLSGNCIKATNYKDMKESGILYLK